jgi:two-component system, chemotaxis family, CheB/CheR fusion protein
MKKQKKQSSKRIKKKPSARAGLKSSVKTTASIELRPDFPVVAIGASAGGVEASSALLKYLQPDLRMAFIFVHHLSPSYNSQLTRILQRNTKMRVEKVEDRMEIQPNCVYVIPPDNFMAVEERFLTLTKRKKSDKHAIDFFMTSLAKSYQHNAIGILLSGTTSDGALGLKAIKKGGGITFVQDETAKHQEMPSHAMDAGYVDYAMPPERIAQELAELIRTRYSVTSPNDELEKNEKEIKKILSIVLQKYDVDFFSHYKRTTVNRRIIRRMALNNIETFGQYARRLQSDQKELDALYNDFLINVTSFFREPSFYTGLSKMVFPQLLKDRKSADPIRVWIPGCATGEEAYSTAITITEFLESKKINVPVQIFSTDLDEKAIAKARAGIYAKNTVAELSRARLEKFFTKIDGHYQIGKSIRDMCVFSVHNLMKDPPFSRIDIVSCQNVLIYIEAAPQRKILQAFHYALKSTGFLLLGKSETIGNATDLFEQLKTEIKLYRKKQTKITLDFSMRPNVNLPAIRKIPEQRTVADVETEFDKILLNRYVPASVLVNKDLDILRFRGPANAFFQPASGKASLNLLKMLKEELIFEMRGLFQKAKKSNNVVSKEAIALDSADQLIRIEISPLKSGKELFYLIVFQIHSPASANVKLPTVKKVDQQSRILKLEQALKDARVQIRTTTEDFDVAREELQSANEEILSSNEELQSINEELETSKEELQSANEELTTINEELQNRIEELKQSNDYIRAIIETMHGPLLVVNNQMRVRTANHAFYSFFNLKPEETDGKFMHELGNGKWNIPALSTQLHDLFPNKVTFKDFEITHHFRSTGKRTMVINAHVLRNTESEYQILLAFQDITDLKANEEKLKQAQEQLKLALEGGAVGTWSWDMNTDAVQGSREEAALFGLPENSFFKTFAEWQAAVHPDDVASVKQSLEKCVASKKPLDIEFRVLQKNGRVRWLLSKANTYYSKDGEPERMMGVNIDITERKQAVEALAESERRFHSLTDHAPVMIWMTDDQQRCNYVNKTWLDFTGKSVEEETGLGWYDGIHPEDREGFLNIYNDAYKSRQEFKADYRLRRNDGEYRWIMAHGVPRYTTREALIGYIGTCIDISERIELERQKDDFMGIASHELKTPVTSIKAYAQILHEKFKKLNDTTSASMLGRLDNQIDKLTNLINTLLDVARIQSGQMDYDKRSVPVRPFVDEVTEEMQRTSPKHKIVTQLSVSDGESFFADREKTAQVLNNLMSNALKYSPEESEVIIKAFKKQDEIIFSVKDSGPGIHKSAHKKIFDRFYRVGEKAGNRVSGLGLGLFISAEIVRQQGGSIWVDSEPGKGAEFWFSLPVANNGIG